MKMKTILFVFLTAIISLIGLQALVIRNAFHSQKEIITENINYLMRKSVEKEAILRFEKTETKFSSNIDLKKIKEHRVNNPDDFFQVDMQDVHKAGAYQLPSHLRGFPFDILALDSILKSELEKVKIFDRFSLIYRDSTGAVIENTDILPPKKMEKSFKTDEMYIIFGNKVQAVVYISPPTVYMQMLGLLLSSFFILIILFFCVAYLTTTIFSQNKLEKIKNEFFHAIVHNTKTPLGSINTVLLKFISGELDKHPEMKNKMGEIAMDQVQRLLLMSEKILTIAKIETDKLILKRSATDMNGMIQELKEMYSISTGKEVSISTSVTIDNDQTIYIDSSLIKEAISNLIDNAIKYSGNQVKIGLYCNMIENTLQIRVSDNGYGISEKLRSKIFKKFERGEAAARNETKGFGLGLNYVELVTEAHGGIVSLNSTEGEGSEFTIALPLQSRPVDNTIK